MTSERASSSKSQGASPYSLQRGKACTNCRKRKIVLVLVCTQCMKSARPGDNCEYADGGRTHTQMLEDNVARLEARIRELEEPDDENAVRLHLPYTSDTTAVPLARHFHSTALSSPVDTPRSSSTSSSPGRSLSSTSSLFHEEPPSDVVQHLLQAFLPYSMDLGFFLNVPRFQNSVLLPLPFGHFSRPCPGLLSTVYLLGVHLLGDPNNQEGVYLSRALLHAANTLSSSHPHRIIHAIQTEILLSVYFFRTGRILEGKYHMSASVSLTLGSGLNKIRSGGGNSDVASPLHQIGAIKPLLAPPTDQVEEGERINAFWMAFTLSNCWGVAVGCLSSMVFEHNGSTIDAPWPLDMSDYEQVMALREHRHHGADARFFRWSGLQDSMPVDYRSIMTVQNFLRQVPSSTSVKEHSTMAMFAKASVLLDRAANLGTLYSSDMAADDASRFGASFSSLDNLIDTFQGSLVLLPLDQHNPSFTSSFGTVLVTHTIAYLSTIQLHSLFISTHSHSRQKALNAARACVTILRQVDMSTVAHVNPILGSCWTSVCQVLIDEIQSMRNARNYGHDLGGTLQGVSEEEMVGMLEKVFATMAVFSMDCPLIGYQLSKVQEAYQAI
ncbi:hypothetical protein BT96DRAFT_975287 [Gymnopus androsaceus JB14]|uniref:Xylanolytic transcriptional activator regulatory domain-containing protein n=1 Tax=Gymnopus androsaceus JB14 TaxID=1447944 RepID=A0A6A4HTH6_9AGAR|nr:hypothetical protein BT96DRAFT_975287 [Gymnopus androsaceus JB14]